MKLNTWADEYYKRLNSLKRKKRVKSGRASLRIRVVDPLKVKKAP